ncbi:MAG TPA: hypothetical protein IAB44_10525 [Candidatus Limivivens intestinipullorum]|uniref:Uncharacterized protein n=1 Tax=Candidatus Limivivens intestinipullorum TaxID=2840858 RepID=A0A9D1EU18_9FIRM|nr:hypothetical protein [Candidatus Limivivens intestinipullorum]
MDSKRKQGLETAVRRLEAAAVSFAMKMKEQKTGGIGIETIADTPWRSGLCA